MKDLSYKLRRLRELQNLTQEYLADQLDISQRAYSKIENGQTRLSVERLRCIAKILKCPVEAILTRRAEDIYMTFVLES